MVRYGHQEYSNIKWLLQLAVVVFVSILMVEGGVRKFNKNTNSSTNESRPHILTRKLSALNQSSPSFGFKSEKYRKNFVKLVENFLLKHIEKALKKKSDSDSSAANDSSDDDDFLTDYYYTTMSDDDISRFVVSRCNQTSGCKLPSNRTEFNWNLAKISNRFKKRLNLAKKNRTQELLDDTKGSSSSKLSNYDYEYFKMKHSISNYRSYTTYFLSVIIFLASACLVLLVVLFASCVINCKQRARLNYYNENEFFTYYNNHAKKLPIVSSVSSFSLTTATPPHYRHTYQQQQHRLNNYTPVAAPPSYCMPPMLTASPAPGGAGAGAPVNGSSSSASDHHHHHHNRLSTHLFGTKSSLTLCNQQQPNYEPSMMTPSGNLGHNHNLINQPSQVTPNGATSSSIFGNFATSTNKSLMGGVGGGLASSSVGLGLSAAAAAQSVTAAQFQQHVTFMNKYQQRLIDTLNPILDGSSAPLSSKELERDREISNENLHKEHINFIAGVRNKKSRLKSCRIGSTDLGEIAETATSVINLKKARQKLRHHTSNSNHRLFDSMATDYITSSSMMMMKPPSQSTLADNNNNNNNRQLTATSTGAISTIDGNGELLPKIKIPSHHSFMNANDEELLSSIASATSCSQRKLKSSLRVPLNIHQQQQQQQQQQAESNPNIHNNNANKNNIADNSSLTNLTIETNDLSLVNDIHHNKEAAAAAKRSGGNLSDKPPPGPSTQLAIHHHTDHLNGNSIHNSQIAAAQSPNFIRDRYYQILREQVFPFLQKPSNNLNINQSPKEIQNYCNDVLY